MFCFSYPFLSCCLPPLSSTCIEIYPCSQHYSYPLMMGSILYSFFMHAPSWSKILFPPLWPFFQRVLTADDRISTHPIFGWPYLLPSIIFRSIVSRVPWRPSYSFLDNPFFFRSLTSPCSSPPPPLCESFCFPCFFNKRFGSS